MVLFMELSDLRQKDSAEISNLSRCTGSIFLPFLILLRFIPFEILLKEFIFDSASTILSDVTFQSLGTVLITIRN